MNYKHWVLLLATAVDDEPLLSDTQEHDELESTVASKELNSAVAAAANQKRFSVTASGYMALIPRESCVGDTFCVLLGIQIPFVLRSAPSAIEKYDLVGPCYCHGIMMGEAVVNNKAKDFLIKYICVLSRRVNLIVKLRMLYPADKLACLRAKCRSTEH
jgi:hypothetical protein